ncbi:MAG: FAD-binding oxidoreductase [candidate division Zixibacteria bacterium]|nr:FAD-binding oxidoreductase [candidate division Zixibacteria bacterium]
MSSFHDEIRAVVSDYVPVDEETLTQYAVDGLTPSAVVAPDSLESLSGLMRLASERGLAVVPRGGGTRMNIGLPPERVDLVVSLARLNRMTEHEPADQTATAQAGMRMTDLQETLSRAGQYLPLDPAHMDRCTLGGVIASNASGPLRWTYGTARDMVIGTKIVQVDGKIVKSGGKVVKNVAGYDLNKMYIGAFGTLGILAEITLKLQPLPETRQAMIGRFPFVSSAMDMAFRVLESNIMPAFLEIANPVPVGILARKMGGGLGDAGFPLIVGVVGAQETVAWQMAETERLFRQAGALKIIPLEDERYRVAFDVLREFPSGEVVPHGMSPGITCRIGVPPEHIGTLYQAMENYCQKARIGCGMTGHFGNGTLTFVFYRETSFIETDVDTLSDIVEELQRTASGLEGFCVVEHAPAFLRKRLAVWGSPRPEWGLMRTLKDRFDPKRLLNPGRFVGGI